MNLINKNILVVGGSGLLGSAVVQRITEAGGTAISADIFSKGSNDHFVEMDIMSEASVVETLKKLTDRFGRLDGLVNTSYPRTKDWGTDMRKVSMQSWRENVDMQLNSVFFLTQQFIEHAINSGTEASVVQFSSIYGIVGPQFDIYEGTHLTTPPHYAAVKGAIVNFTRFLAARFGRDKIRINCVSPGGIYNQQSETFLAQYSKKVPLGRMGTAADIAPAVCFLLSDEAKYITGHNLVIDGGWTAI